MAEVPVEEETVNTERNLPCRRLNTLESQRLKLSFSLDAHEFAHAIWVPDLVPAPGSATGLLRSVFFQS